MRICDAKFGNIFRWDGEAFHLVAAHNTPPAFAKARKRSPFHPGPEKPFGRILETKSVVHFPIWRLSSNTLNARSALRCRPLNWGAYGRF